MTYIILIILVGAIQGFLLSVLFFIKKNILFNKLFALILFTISLALLLAYLQNILDFKNYPFLIKVSFPLSLIFIPSLLIYLKKLTGSFVNTSKNILLYFSPFLLIIIANIPFYLGSSNMKIAYYIRNEQTGNPLITERLEFIFVELMVVIFSLLAINEARSYNQEAKNYLSNLSKTRGGWIQIIAIAMFVLTAFALLLSVSSLFLNNVPLELNFITAVCSTFLIYFIAYYLLSTPEALTDISKTLQPAANSTIEANVINVNGSQPQLADAEQATTPDYIITNVMNDASSIANIEVNKEQNQEHSELSEKAVNSPIEETAHTNLKTENEATKEHIEDTARSNDTVKPQTKENADNNSSTDIENNLEEKETHLQAYEQKIIKCLEEEKIYLDPDLNISELASKTGIPIYLTSKIINQNLKTNFYALINKYRLDFAKQELLTNASSTIIEIAYSSGFNSKTTFYASFKKDTGCSPSQFIKKNKE